MAKKKILNINQPLDIVEFAHDLVAIAAVASQSAAVDCPFLMAARAVFVGIAFESVQ